MQKITIYGKGGVGKSTVASNLAACLQARGQAAALIGCSPKADSTYFLLGGPCRPTMLDSLRGGAAGLRAVEACVRRDTRGIVCVETGGPEPAAGCAGRGVSHALNLLDRSGLLARAGVEWALYDVIADVVCGGFTEPMKRGYGANGAPALIYIVTSAELMSLYAANNICSAVETIRREQGVALRVGGLIHNRRGIENEEAMVERFAGMLSVPVIAALPRTHLVQAAEAQRGLVVELFPESEIARGFSGLAERVLALEGVQPTPLPPAASIALLSEMAADFQPAKFPAVDNPTAGRARLGAPTRQATLPTPTPAAPGMARSAPRPPRYPTGQPRRIAVYGKAGIGKSTISANLSAALAGLGEQVMQIGCDPKRDSVALLAHRMIPTVLEQMHGAQARPPSLESVVYSGFGGVQCVEAGGPPAGTGCAGQGVFYALEMLEAASVFTRCGITFSVFDILGDVVCGGFAQPIRGGFCREVYVVTNGEPLSLLVSNNILRAVQRMRAEGIPVGVAGLINNRRGAPNEDAVVEAFAEVAGVPVLAHIPRSPLVQAAEAHRQTVLEAFPDSEQAAIYRTLAQVILENEAVYIPRPVDDIDAVLDLFARTSMHEQQG